MVEIVTVKSQDLEVICVHAIQACSCHSRTHVRHLFFGVVVQKTASLFAERVTGVNFKSQHCVWHVCIHQELLPLSGLQLNRIWAYGMPRSCSPRSCSAAQISVCLRDSLISFLFCEIKLQITSCTFFLSTPFKPGAFGNVSRR